MSPRNENEMVDTLPTDLVVRKLHPVYQVTSLSKYLALGLFVVLPFVGAYVGYQFAPVKQVAVTVPDNVTGTTSTTIVNSSEKTSPQVLMVPLTETPQIEFFKRAESKRSTEITFIPNSDFEKENGDVVFAGMLKFYLSDYSGTWVGEFIPNEETLSMLPIGEPESLPEYFYIVDPDTVSVLCDSFNCVEYIKGEVYTAEISFKPDRITYETYNIGFGSYPKTLTFAEVEIISPTN